MPSKNRLLASVLVAGFSCFAPLIVQHRPYLSKKLELSGLSAQSRPTPQRPVYEPPKTIDKATLQDLLPPGPSLGSLAPDISNSSKQSRSSLDIKANNLFYHKRYQERQWQQLYEEGNDRLLLEQALLYQFGSQGFTNNLGKIPYHESPQRRFEIVFLLSLPFSALYAYGLVSLIKILSGSPKAGFNNVETGSFIGMALGFSAFVGWYDNRQVKLHKEGKGEWEDQPSSELNLQIQKSF